LAQGLEVNGYKAVRLWKNQSKMTGIGVMNVPKLGLLPNL